MLVLKRLEGEGIVLHTSQGMIRVIVGKDNKLAIDAPKQVKVLRSELVRHDADSRKQN